MKVINRIKKNEDFALAIKTGRSIRADSFVLHIKKNELTHARVGVSVSKKLGNAVVRNHIKRQIRSMCEAHVDYSKSVDIVIVARHPYLDRTYQENSDILKLYLSQFI